MFQTCSTETETHTEVEDDISGSSWSSASSGYLSIEDHKETMENEDGKDTIIFDERLAKKERRENQDGKATKSRHNKIARHNKIVPRSSSSYMHETLPADLSAANSEKFDADSVDAPYPEEVTVLLGELDYLSVHAHSGPLSLEEDEEEGALDESVSEKPFLDHLLSPALPVVQPEDESWTDSVDTGIPIMNTQHKETEMYSGSFPGYHGWTYEPPNETEVYSAFVPDYHGWTYETHMTNEDYRECLAQSIPHFSATTNVRALNAQLWSTLPTSALEAQNYSCSQLSCKSAAAKEFSSAKCKEGHAADKRTSVMLMNIPFGYTSSKLISTLDSQGFAGLYDFLYVPMNFQARASRGCALVNLLDPFIAKRFMTAFEGFSGWSTKSRNVCRTHWARQYQGLQANVDHYRNASVMCKSVPHEYKPRLFKNGTEIMFPAPTPKPSVANRRYGRPRKTKKDKDPSS
eukprot:TRINITY_DN4983_c0_g1_i1.p1 TRINITY_DN4983_c0_g1~~TRINITY_DN4983_c0_g1_i1.p1  ORF type:complete len:462 (-),score=51.51 TRINITY_DN4983_c0_g1_i1:276-1661(-)